MNIMLTFEESNLISKTVLNYIIQIGSFANIC